MSNYPVDTLTEQIERGEVAFCTAGATNLFDEGDKKLIAIETGLAPCYLTIEIGVEVTVNINIYEDVTSFVSSSSRTMYNMRRDTANPLDTTVDEASSIVGGTIIWGFILSDGKAPRTSPLNLESGLLLKPSTIYVYEIDNIGLAASVFRVDMFLREI